jgi:tetratricopeptide (TPR) repeat protein
LRICAAPPLRLAHRPGPREFGRVRRAFVRVPATPQARTAFAASFRARKPALAPGAPTLTVRTVELKAGRQMAGMGRISASALLTLLCTAVAAQEPPSGLDDPDPRRRQAALHAALLSAPDDPELMLAYARASTEALDFEAVIATLERALIYRPGDAAVMVELGAAYFRLGSWAAARQYFEAARAAGLPPEAEETLERYLAAIDQRAARSRITGSVSLGLAASTNANLGVDDRNVRFFGLPAVLERDAEAQSDTGFRATAQATHTWDLGTPRLDHWRTDASFYTLRFFEEDEGDTDSLSIATGPSLSLDERAYGPKIRPFVGARIARSDDEKFYVEYGGGATISQAIDATWGFLGRLDIGRRDYAEDFDDYDATVVRGLIGGSYTLAPGRTLFAAVVAETDRGEERFTTNAEAGLRLAGSFDYDPGFAFADAPSTFSAYAQVSARDWSGPDPTVDPGRTRDDVDVLLGVSNLTRLRRGLGVQIDVDAARRESNIANFDTESLTGVVSVVYEF